MKSSSRIIWICLINISSDKLSIHKRSIRDQRRLIADYEKNTEGEVLQFKDLQLPMNFHWLNKNLDLECNMNGLQKLF